MSLSCYGHQCSSSRHHCRIFALVRFTHGINSTDCRILGEAYHKIPSILWSHDTVITDLPSPLTSRPSGPANIKYWKSYLWWLSQLDTIQKIIAQLETRTRVLVVCTHTLYRFTNYWVVNELFKNRSVSAV